MTKRIVTLILAVVFVLSCTLLAACGKSDTTDDKGTSKPSQTPSQGASSPAKPTETPSEPASSTPAPATPSDDPTTPSNSEIPTQPENHDSQEWINWLLSYGESQYTKVYWGEVFNVAFKDAAGTELSKKSSGWETWDETKAPDGTRYHLCYMFDAAEVDFTSNIGSDEYAFTWDIWYRESGTENEYKKITTAPWSVYHFDNGRAIYRIPVYDDGMNDLTYDEDLSYTTYEMVFVISDKDSGEIQAYHKAYIDYTDAAEMYLEKARTNGWLKSE